MTIIFHGFKSLFSRVGLYLAKRHRPLLTRLLPFDLIYNLDFRSNVHFLVVVCATLKAFISSRKLIRSWTL